MASHGQILRYDLAQLRFASGQNVHGVDYVIAVFAQYSPNTSQRSWCVGLGLASLRKQIPFFCAWSIRKAPDNEKLSVDPSYVKNQCGMVCAIPKREIEEDKQQR